MEASFFVRFVVQFPAASTQNTDYQLNKPHLLQSRPDRNEAQHSLGFLRFKLLPSLLPFRQALRQEGKWPLQLKFYPAEHTGLPSKKALGKWCFQIRCPRVQKELPLTPKEVLLAEIFSPRKVEPLHFILIIIFQLLVRLDRINGPFRGLLTSWFTVA